MEQKSVDPQYYRSILDAVEIEMAVVSVDGDILYTNAAWDRFTPAAYAVLRDQISVGANYLTVLANAIGSDAVNARAVDKGLRDVIQGVADLFETEYPCAPPGEDQWFLMRVIPLQDTAPRPVVVTHQNITRYRQTTVQAVQSAFNNQLQAQQQREMSFLETVSAHPSTTITATLYGKAPIRDTAPPIFGSLVSQYGRILEQAVEQRTYRTNDNLSMDLRGLAQQLRFLNAGPRDVLDIHLTAVKTALRRAPHSHSTMLIEEARPLALELMGELLAIYRLEAVANRHIDTQRGTA